MGIVGRAHLEVEDSATRLEVLVDEIVAGLQFCVYVFKV